MTATGEGVILALSFNSHVLGSIHLTSKLHSCFSWEARCLCAVWKERILLKCCNVTAVAVLALSQRGSGSIPASFNGSWQTSSGLLLFFPCLRHPGFWGEGKTGNKHSSCSPNLKITETVLLQRLSHTSTQ